MQRIGGFLFLFVYDMRINLRGFDVSMSHQRLDGVYVNSIFQQQRSVAMAATMEGDVLLDTGNFYPDFQRARNPRGISQSFKNKCFIIVWTYAA